LDAFGRFSVRFRYPIVLVWLTGAVAATQLLPQAPTGFRPSASAWRWGS
jgi:uncharacterized membrane protein YdfJ with MMPL/SSD domain